MDICFLTPLSCPDHVWDLQRPPFRKWTKRDAVLKGKKNPAHLLFCYLCPGLNAILLIDVDIPTYIEEGSNAKLSCLYEVEYDGLYR